MGRDSKACVFSGDAPAERRQLQRTVQAQIKAARAGYNVRGQRKVRQPERRIAVNRQVRCAAVLCDGAVNCGSGAASRIQDRINKQRFARAARRTCGGCRPAKVRREQPHIPQIGGKADDIILIIAAARRLNIKLGRIDGQRVDPDCACIRAFQNSGQIRRTAHQLVHRINAGAQVDGLAPDVCRKRAVRQIHAARAGKLCRAAQGLPDKAGQWRQIVDVDRTLCRHFGRFEICNIGLTRDVNFRSTWPCALNGVVQCFAGLRGVAVQIGAAGHVGEDIVQVRQFGCERDPAAITVGGVQAIGLNRTPRRDDVKVADGQAKRIHNRIDLERAAAFQNAVGFGDAGFGAVQNTIGGHVEMTGWQAVTPVCCGLDTAAKGPVRDFRPDRQIIGGQRALAGNIR